MNTILTSIIENQYNGDSNGTVANEGKNGEVMKVNGQLKNEVQSYQKSNRELNDKLKTIQYVNEQLRGKLSHRNSFVESANGDVRTISPRANGILNILKSDSRWDEQ